LATLLPAKKELSHDSNIQTQNFPLQQNTQHSVVASIDITVAISNDDDDTVLGRYREWRLCLVDVIMEYTLPNNNHHTLRGGVDSE
jgi:hypothetical protein